jgi:hypothetical protein
MEGVNSTIIQFKNFCKFHNFLQYNNNLKDSKWVKDFSVKPETLKQHRKTQGDPSRYRHGQQLFEKLRN